MVKRNSKVIKRATNHRFLVEFMAPVPVRQPAGRDEVQIVCPDDLSNSGAGLTFSGSLAVVEEVPVECILIRRRTSRGNRR